MDETSGYLQKAAESGWNFWPAGRAGANKKPVGKTQLLPHQ
jgi:hypothetical protein